MNNSRIFWALNTIGWGGIFASNLLARGLVLPKLNWGVEAFGTGVLVIVGFILTVGLRVLVSRTQLLENKAISILTLSFGLTFLIAILHTFLMLGILFICYPILFGLPTGAFFPQFVANFIVVLFIYMMWMGGYIGSKYFIRIQQMKVEQLRLEKALNQAQLNSLIGQLNPHYMFNALNNIRALMLEDVDRARAMLSSLSASLRYSLNSHKQQKVSLEKELKVVGHFIELSRIQLEDRLHYQEKVEEDIHHYQLPPMLIQLLIENAIKHGISRLVEGGFLQLKIKKEYKYLLIEVENDYDPDYKNLEESTQIGLKNIEERLELIYGNKASFSYEEGERKVVVGIHLPLEEV